MIARMGHSMSISPIQQLEERLHDSTHVYVNSGVDENEYFADLAESIRKNLCEPFEVSATVMEPGFPDDHQRPVGSVVSGLCLAHSEGYWLVYDEMRDDFMCFWGTSPTNLGAHGIFGPPLYCWSA